MAGERSNDAVQSSSTKSKKHKKKKAKEPQKLNGDVAHSNGVATSPVEDDKEDDGADAEGPDGSVPNTPINPDHADEAQEPSQHEEEPQPVTQPEPEVSVGDSDTASRLATAAQERDQLREEVAQIRRSLEDVKRKYDEDIARTKSELEEAKSGHEQAETKYQKLRGQVNTIKTQLGERLKADAAELSSTRERVEELEEEGKTTRDSNAALQSQVLSLTSQLEQQAQEIDTLRGRSNLSQQNWAKERDDLLTQEAQAREECEAFRQALQDREVLAMEERSLREGLDERIVDLDEQLSKTRAAYDRAASERDSQNTTVDGLQRALQEVHDARKEERRELVETSKAQMDELTKQFNDSEAALREAQASLEKTRSDFERAAPFEKEVREKNLLIGKMRHETVILNDNLTKTLRFLKRGNKDDNVDRQLVTNHFLQFLALDRSDPKKFQILQLISALLGWTDEQKESAGIARPGASTQTSLRVPLSSPFRRVSSSAALSPITNSFSSVSSPPGTAGSFDSTLSPNKEGLAELWSEFLEREAEDDSQGKGAGSVSSRRGSGSSTPRIRAMMSPTTGPSASSPQLKNSSIARRLDDVAESSGA